MHASSFRQLFRTLPLIALLACGVRAADAEKPLKALLVTGGCCHDYKNQWKTLTEGLSKRMPIQWTVVLEGEGTKHQISIYTNQNWAAGYDIVIHDECFADVKDEAFVRNILRAHAEGVPAVNLHCAMHCYRVNFDTFKEWFAFTGLDSRGHGPQKPIEVKFTGGDHPIVKGLADWTTIPEELYNNKQIWDTVTPLARGTQTIADKDGKTRTEDCLIAWANQYKNTRVFSTTLGHNTATVGADRYLDLIVRGMRWATGRSAVPPAK